MKEIKLNHVVDLSRREVKLLVLTLRRICPEDKDVVDLKVDFFNKDITIGETMYYWD